MSECVKGCRSTAKKRWIEAFGLIPNGMWVLHRCDNPNCINLEHLFLGSSSDNAKDREAKGRGVGWTGKSRPFTDDAWRTANAFGNSNVTLEQVKIIRSSNKSIKELSKELSLHYAVIWRIKTRRTWRHV